MAEALLMSVDEYLRSSFRPDCDYVDGEVLERNLSERSHSIIQAALVAIFHLNRINWKIVILPEQRVQVSATRYRVPDVCVVRKDDPPDPIVHKAPLLCIEVLSPEDRLTRVRARIDDYLAIGVENVWLLDPEARRAYTASADGFRQIHSGELSIPGTEIVVSLAEIFDELD
jgi:Uma2 family endonuclease